MGMTEEQLENLKQEMIERDTKEMARITHIIDNHLDSDGNSILDKFPHLVELSPPFIDSKYDGCLEWVSENIKRGQHKRVWVTKFYFKNMEDAAAFKLRWL